ncbi:uncharacterized protein [Diadema antillarum]|uniref:uncharacterized protein n=1 Tax=Diadema antillarum TaxID=105358 RepID=UPI003A87682F
MQPAGVASAFSIASLTASLSHHHPQPYPHPAAVTTSAMMCAAGYPPAALPLPYANATSCSSATYGGSLALPSAGTTCAGRSGVDVSEMSMVAAAGTQCAMSNAAGSAGGGSIQFAASHHHPESYSRQGIGDSAEVSRNLSLIPNSRHGLMGVADLNIPRWSAYNVGLEPGTNSAISSRISNGHGLDAIPTSLGSGGGGVGGGGAGGGSSRDYAEALNSPPASYSPTGM